MYLNKTLDSEEEENLLKESISKRGAKSKVTTPKTNKAVFGFNKSAYD